jgi:hypothetical protein
MSTLYKVWLHVEKISSSDDPAVTAEDYEDLGDPEELGSFTVEADALDFSQNIIDACRAGSLHGPSPSHS